MRDRVYPKAELLVLHNNFYVNNHSIVYNTLTVLASAPAHMRVSAGLAKSFLSLEGGVLTAGLWQGLKHWSIGGRCKSAAAR